MLSAVQCRQNGSASGEHATQLNMDATQLNINERKKQTDVVFGGSAVKNISCVRFSWP